MSLTSFSKLVTLRYFKIIVLINDNDFKYCLICGVTTLIFRLQLITVNPLFLFVQRPSITFQKLDFESSKRIWVLMIICIISNFTPENKFKLCKFCLVLFKAGLFSWK
jgi:hypothetical protein